MLVNHDTMCKVWYIIERAADNEGHYIRRLDPAFQAKERAWQKTYDALYTTKDRKNKQAVTLVRKRRAQVIITLGTVCCRCGFDDPRALQIDHIDGGGVKEYRTVSRSIIYKNIIAGASGYQLLCANCNWIKRFENNEH